MQSNRKIAMSFPFAIALFCSCFPGLVLARGGNAGPGQNEVLVGPATGKRGDTSSKAAIAGEPAFKSSAIPAPKDVIGFTPGDDRKLASWPQIVEYFRRLSAASNRVKFDELGKTTLGRPFVLATISSPANLAKLDYYRGIQEKLADPRKINSDDAGKS